MDDGWGLLVQHNKDEHMSLGQEVLNAMPGILGRMTMEFVRMVLGIFMSLLW